MYESGVKVGVMGGEDKTSEKLSTPAAQPEDCPETTGKIVDQTINEMPDRNSTPPGYRPNTTPPSDPNARIVP